MTYTGSKRDWPEDRLDPSGQRQLTCPVCTLTYVGKAGRILCKDCATQYPNLQQVET